MLKTASIFLIIILRLTNGYRWTVLDDDDKSVCNDQMCPSATGALRMHSACVTELQPQCDGFEPLTLSSRDIRAILDGHNGLRNRVAKIRHVSNMNVLHWDYDLQKMAEGWINHCILDGDTCNFIYDASHSVGQNVYFTDASLPARGWGTKVVRRWFLEGNQLNESIWEQYSTGQVRFNELGNFTQLMWPNTEFVGCAGAEMFDGFFVVCNYHPKGNLPNEPIFQSGKPCSNCSMDRPSCSRIYHSLCGIDMYIGNASRTGTAHLILLFPIAFVIQAYLAIRWLV